MILTFLFSLYFSVSMTIPVQPNKSEYSVQPLQLSSTSIAPPLLSKTEAFTLSPRIVSAALLYGLSR